MDDEARREMEAAVFGPSSSQTDASQNEYLKLVARYPTLAHFSTDVSPGLNHLAACMNRVNNLDLDLPLAGPVSETVTTTLSDTVQLVSRATGACIYAVAMYPDGEDGCEVFECASDRIVKLLDSSLSEGMRTHFLRTASLLIGPTLSREAGKVFPTVYGLPDQSFRPRLPPQQRNQIQECLLYVDYIQKLAEWQGIPFSWEGLQADFAQGKHRMVLRHRLPAGATEIGHPSKIDFRQVALLLAYCRWGQERWDAGDLSILDVIFQLTGPERSDIYQDAPAATSKLVYNEDAAFYMLAERKLHFLPDSYMPSALPEPMYASHEDMLYRLADPLNTETRDLKSMLELLRTIDQPEYQPQDNEHALHRAYRYDSSNVLSHLEHPMLREEVYNWMHQNHKSFEFGSYVRWVTNGGLIDPEEKIICGGYNGIFAAYFNGLRLQITKRTIATLPQLQTNPYILKFDGSDMQTIVTTLFIYLRDRARDALRDRAPRQRIELPPGNRLTPFSPKSVQYRQSNGRTGTIKPEAARCSKEQLKSLRLGGDHDNWPYDSTEEAPVYNFTKAELLPNQHGVKTQPFIPSVVAAPQAKVTASIDPRPRPATVHVKPVPLPHGMEPSASGASRRSTSEPRPKATSVEEPGSNDLGLDLREPLSAPSTPEGGGATTVELSQSNIEFEAETSTPHVSRGRPRMPRTEQPAHSAAKKKFPLRVPASPTASSDSKGKSTSTSQPVDMEVDDVHPATPVDLDSAEKQAETVQEGPSKTDKRGPRTRSASKAPAQVAQPTQSALPIRQKTPSHKSKSGPSSRAASTGARSAGSGSQGTSLRVPSREPALIGTSAADMSNHSVNDYLNIAVKSKVAAPGEEESEAARVVPAKNKRGSSPDPRDDTKKPREVSRPV